jgi:DNA-binding transcriptional LysR family regulator
LKGADMSKTDADKPRKPRSVSFDDLAIFVAVAKAGSFREISRVKGLSKSAVSMAVQRLESQMDVTLLERTTRSVFPTFEGARLLQRLIPAFLEVEAAVAGATMSHSAAVTHDADVTHDAAVNVAGSSALDAIQPSMPELDRKTWP